MKCIFCGGELFEDNDFFASDVYGECYDEDECAMVSYMHCMTCGRSYQISDPLKEDRDTIYSDYWNKDNNGIGIDSTE